MNQLKSMDSKKKFTFLLLLFFLIQPIINLDYLFYDWYKGLGLLAPSTMVNLAGIFFLFVFSWWIFEKDKLKVFISWAIYGGLIVGYFILHFLVTRSIDVYFPASYQWSSVVEIKYILYLIVPFPLIYAVYKARFSKQEFNTIILFTSAFISIMLVMTNLLVVSYGSYGHITYDNIFSWFNGAYDVYEARELTSIGFYEKANPVGALLFMLYPLVMKIMIEEKKWIVTFIFAIQTVAMYVIGTRVAAYGTILLPAAVLVLFLFSVLIKKMKFDLTYCIKLLLAVCISVCIYQYTPACKSNEFDYRDQPWVQENERAKDEMLKGLEGLEDEEYKWALIFLFETQFVYFLTFPREYYEYYYSYKLDPEFWLMIFETPFEQRMNGRQIQQIFSDYKFDELSSVEKAVGGLAYSRLSNGGIVLEQDFMRQYYALGWVGMLLCTFPYLALLLVAALTALIQFKKKYSFELVITGMAACGMLGVGFYSGHVLDEMLPSYFLALVIGYLFVLLTSKGGDSNEA